MPAVGPPARARAVAALAASFTRSDGSTRFDASSCAALIDIVTHLDASSSPILDAPLSALWQRCASASVSFAELASLPTSAARLPTARIASRIAARADDACTDACADDGTVDGNDDTEHALVRIGYLGAQCAIVDAALEEKAGDGRYGWVSMYALEHARRMERAVRGGAGAGAHSAHSARAALAAILHASGAALIVDGARALSASVDGRALLFAIESVHAWAAAAAAAQLLGAGDDVVNALAAHEDDGADDAVNASPVAILAEILAEADRSAARYARIPLTAAKSIRPIE